MMHRKRDKRSFRERYTRFMKELSSQQAVEVVTPTLSWVAKVLYHPSIHGYSPLLSGISYKRKLAYVPRASIYQGSVVSRSLPISQV